MVPSDDNDSRPAEVAEEVLEKLLAMMEVSASVDQVDSDPVTINVSGDDLGILIGRRGQTLACLQYIVRLMVSHQTQEWEPVVIDVEGYKQRRYETLQALAYRVADQVKARGMPFTMEPMLPYERRIIHLALADSADVITRSTGEGEERKVVVAPRR